MKKILIFLIVLIMIFTLFGCGEEKINIDDVLLSGDWHRIGSTSYYSFYKTGTGSLHSGDDDSVVKTLNITWTKLEDNFIRIELSSTMGISGTFDYELIKTDEGYSLVNVAGNGDDYVLVSYTD